MFPRSIKFGIKSFSKQLGLSTHFTIGGLFRRLSRQYPLPYKLTKFSIIFSIAFTTSSLIIPGSNLPFQSIIKHYLMNKIQALCKIWYLHTGIPDFVCYIMNTYHIIFYYLDNNIKPPQHIIAYLDKINSVMQGKASSLSKIKNNARIQNIVNSVELLTRMIKNYQISNNPNSLIGNKQILKQYHRILDNSILTIDGQLRDKYKEEVGLSLKIFQYLLKYEQLSQKQLILGKLIRFLKMPDRSFFALIIIKNQPFKSQLKRIVKADPKLQPTIMQLLQILEELRKKQ